MKDGDYYDVCPHDGCLEVDASHRSEGAGYGSLVEQHHDWSIFSADLRDGGCGATWTRTTTSGLERDRRRGVRSANLTASAGKGRHVSVPSPVFAERYEAIFGHP